MGREKVGCGRCGPDVPMRILPAVPPRPDLCRAVRRTVLVSMRARSIEPVFCHSLIASRYGTAIISQTLFLILVNRYRTILKPLSNGSSIVEQDALAVTQMMLCMATGIFRRRFCSYLFSFVACCLSASVGRGFSESRWRRWPWSRRTATSSDSSSNLVK